MREMAGMKSRTKKPKWELELPTLYKAASVCSASSQRAFFGCLFANLLFLTTTIALSKFSDTHWIVGFVQALLLLAGLAALLYLSIANPQRDWYAARALAESVKTMTWRFCMRAEPYDIPRAKEHFIENLSSVLKDNSTISHKIKTFSGKQVPDQLEQIRASSQNERVTVYLEHRIIDQLNWYTNKSELNGRRSKQFFVTISLLYGIAIVLAFARVKIETMDFWYVDLITVFAGSALTWLQSKRHQELAASYALTAHEIGLLKEKIRPDMRLSDFSAFIGDAENAFSREHTQWRARRDVD
jgi:SMODS and SLOG-associating 2TM effector domain 1/SMODS and SLOG-associating 2TM effector domain 3